MNFLRIALYCLIGGLVMTVGAIHAGGFGWWWLGGILFAAAFVPVARFGPAGWLKQFGVILPVFIMVTVLCTWSEAMIFVVQFRHDAVRNITSPVVLYTIFAALLATLAVVLKLHREDGPTPQLRPAAAMVPLVLLCGAAYAAYYLVFGGITYQYFTRQYYPDAMALVATVGPWFWPIEIGRGVLMTLAVLPAIRTLRLKRWQTAIVVGMMVWVTGGLAPLVLPNEFMGPRQRFIHTIEILTQNASLGFTAGLLLRRREGRKVNEAPSVAVAA